MADWKKATITLAYPVTVAGVTRSEVTIREPDLEALEVVQELGITEHFLLDDDGKPQRDEDGSPLLKNPTIKEMRKVLTVISDLPNEFIGKLHRDDYMKVAGAMLPLLFGPQDGSGSTAAPNAQSA